MPRITRACDACRTRKVRCDGAHPCAQCSHFDVHCIFSPPEKRKNPIRGRLVAQVRGEVNDSSRGSEARSEKAASTASPESPSPHAQHATTSAPSGTHRPPYPPEFFAALFSHFDSLVWPVNPIITAEELRGAIANMHASSVDAALAWAFASATTFLTTSSRTLQDSQEASKIDDLMQRSLEAHKQADLVMGDGGRMLEEHPVTVKRIVTCIFLEISMMAFKRFERSFALLREAITMIQIFKVRGWPATAQETSRLQRLYWEAYIHERFLTIASGYPSILPPLDTGLPLHDPSLPPHIEEGFNRLISLFKVLDTKFLKYWQEQQGPARSDVTVEWIESKQAQLDRDEIEAADVDQLLRARGKGSLSEFQHADLFVTRLWLRTILWQVALSNGLLSSVPRQDAHEGLSLEFPAQRLAVQLQNLVSRLGSVASISTQGSGIVQKLFEITSTVGEVLALPVGNSRPVGEMMEARVADFVVLVGWLSQFERIREEQRQYLEEKLNVLKALYPGI